MKHTTSPALTISEDVTVTKKKDVIGFGALNLDLIYEVPDSFFEEKRLFEPSGEITGDAEGFDSILSLVESVGTLRDKSGGGSAANTIVALSKMGFDTGYIGKVGDDSEGAFLLRSLGMVDTSRVQRGDRTGLCIVLLDHAGERSNMVLPNANDSLTYDEIDLSYVENTLFLHMTSFVGDPPFDAQRQLAEKLSSEVKISFDPGELYSRRGLDQILPILKRSYIVFATDREVEFMTGRNYKEGSKELLNYGLQVVVCKLGEKGSYILAGGEEFDIPAERTRVLDKTGAGDVFAAGFLAGLILERPLWDCVLFATKAASLSISGYGRERYPNREFMLKVLNTNQPGTFVDWRDP